MLPLLRTLLFLLQCKKVQLSGESAICVAAMDSISSRGRCVFQGASSLSLDAKGRLSVPTRHRDVLSATAGQLTITKHPHGCLMVFPRPSGEVPRAHRPLPMSAQWWKRIFLGNAMDVDAMAAAVLISPELRAAGITKDAMLLGMGEHFELWDKATYDAQEAQAMQGDMPDVFKDFLSEVRLTTTAAHTTVLLDEAVDALLAGAGDAPAASGSMPLRARRAFAAHPLTALAPGASAGLRQGPRSHPGAHPGCAFFHSA
jgi:MraZ protein